MAVRPGPRGASGLPPDPCVLDWDGSSEELLASAPGRLAGPRPARKVIKEPSAGIAPRVYEEGGRT
jgi:hypothetical protein